VTEVPAWMMTPEAVAFQRNYVAQLVATGQWTGPTPSDGVLALAATMSDASAFALAA
jgi:hypothetical protein